MQHAVVVLDTNKMLPTTTTSLSLSLSLLFGRRLLLLQDLGAAERVNLEIKSKRDRERGGGT